MSNEVAKDLGRRKKTTVIGEVVELINKMADEDGVRNDDSNG